MNSNSQVSMPFQYDPANHRNPVINVVLSNPQSVERNQTQRDLLYKIDPRLAELTSNGLLNGLLPCAAKYTLYEPDAYAQAVRSFNEEPIFRNALYLYHIIVAVEWNPSARYHQQIRNALKQASHFLYDATNGYAAIGLVVIGGPDLMPAADIQIMASNRLHPRAWVDALNQPAKFKPIRVGRGLWQKNESILSPWDSPEGYRALVHEWGHYAFGLADDYLEPIALTRQATGRLWNEQPAIPYSSDSATDLSIVAPKIALAVNTLMANDKISEFIEWPTIIRKLRESLSVIALDPRPLDGPNELPLPLPEFIDLAANGFPQGIAIEPSQGAEWYLPIAAALNYAQRNGAQQRADQSHWLYILKQFGNQQLPQQLIAQGKTGDVDRDNGFLLYGAAQDDAVLLISQVGGRVVVQRTTVQLPTAANQQQLVALPWQDVTPPDIDSSFFVDVIPRPIPILFTPGTPTMQADVYVQVETARKKPDQIQIYPAGYSSTDQATPLAWVSDQVGVTSIDRKVPNLDGHVLLRWTNPSTPWEGLFIVSYSQGGGPNTSGGGRLPITAGSADGNAMVFFRDNDPPLSKKPGSQPDEGVRIVTTTLTVGQQVLSNGAEARSYVFSLASNTDLSGFPATLVLYYDREATKRGGDLLIHRWDAANTKWVSLTTYAPLLPYVAIPLMPVAATAPALVQNSETAVERYRVFWTPTDTKLTG